MRQHGVACWRAKLELLEELARGRTVLHVGAVGETGETVERKLTAAVTSVHAHLTRVASSCVGVDLDARAVRALTEAGAFDNLVAADATTITRDRIPLPSIDLIVAGDVLEHLSCPGELLDAMARLSDPGTRLVLTTPNALGLPMFLRYLRGQVLEGPDHKVSFNLYTLRNLLAHHGWAVEYLATCHQPRATQLHGRPGMGLGRIVLARWPSLGGTLFVVVRPMGPVGGERRGVATRTG